MMMTDLIAERKSRLIVDVDKITKMSTLFQGQCIYIVGHNEGEMTPYLLPY